MKFWVPFLLFLVLTLHEAEFEVSRKRKQGQPRRRVQEKPKDICDPIHANSVDAQDILDEALRRGREGELISARICLETFTSLAPDDERGWTLLSEVSTRLEEHEDALTAALKAVDINADSADALFQVGTAMMSLSRNIESEEYFSRALELDPEHVHSLTNLATLRGNLHDHRRAVILYERVLQLKPDFFAARYNLATALHALKQFVPARAMLEELREQVRALSAARDSYAAALRMRPQSAEAMLQLYTTKQQLVDWDGLEELFRSVMEFTEEEISIQPTDEEAVEWAEAAAAGVGGGAAAVWKPTTVSLYYSLLSPFPPDQLLAIARSHARFASRGVASVLEDLAFAPFHKLLPPPSGGGVGKGRAERARLRVGYIMSDWRQHVTAHLLQTVFGRHDPRRVSPACFALNPDDGGSFRRRIRESVTSIGGDFVEVHGLSDEDVASTINRHQVHVLVDMDYYKERLAVLALQPAEVQVAFLAHPGSTGADFVQYLVIDRVVATPEMSPYLFEGLVYMRHHYQVNDHAASYPHQPRPHAVIRRDEGLPAPPALVLANFNGLYKVEPGAMRLWLEILDSAVASASATPPPSHRSEDKEDEREDGARQVALWLVSAGSAEADAHLRRRLGRHVSRAVLATSADFADHIQRTAAADLFLDSFTYTAHTTAVDALWGGVPVVTRPGETISSRLATGALGAFGPGGGETVVRDVADYLALATRLSTHPSALARLRGWLQIGGRPGLESRPLFDTTAWVQDFEGCLLLLADLAAAHREGGDSGNGASRRGRRHVVRAARPEWRWRVRRGTDGGG